jgi:hypothetical protein
MSDSDEIEVTRLHSTANNNQASPRIDNTKKPKVRLGRQTNDGTGSAGSQNE